MLFAPATSTTRLGVRTKALAAFALGAATTLGLPPFFLWPVAFLTFSGLVWLFDDAAAEGQPAKNRRLRRFGIIGWAFGFGYFLAGTYWVGYSFLSNPTPFPILTAIGMVLAVLALTAALGLFHAAAAVGYGWAWRRGVSRLPVFALAFFAAELARTHILTGFPWNLFGTLLTATDGMMQAASLFGVTGLSLIALLIFASPAALFPHPAAQPTPKAWPLLLAGAAILLLSAYGSSRLENAPPQAAAGIKVRIVQPNVPQLDKWKPENRKPIFDRLLALSRDANGKGPDASTFDYVVWPESSVPFLFVFNQALYSQEARQLLTAAIPGGTRFIIGAERAEGSTGTNGLPRFERVYNSVFKLGPEAAVEETYDKVHLVPFGEYMPLGSIVRSLGISALSHQADGFTAGPRATPVLTGAKGDRFVPLICYEVIFPHRLREVGARPDWIVNVTNDAWFGPSSGPAQHLHLARLRAVEEGLPVVRAANTGVSAIIDAYGRVTASLSLNRTGTVEGVVPPSLPPPFIARLRAEVPVL
jgi:apolipoprotein N-acyltransferase